MQMLLWNPLETVSLSVSCIEVLGFGTIFFTLVIMLILLNFARYVVWSRIRLVSRLGCSFVFGFDVLGYLASPIWRQIISTFALPSNGLKTISRMAKWDVIKIKGVHFNHIILTNFSQVCSWSTIVTQNQLIFI